MFPHWGTIGNTHGLHYSILWYQHMYMLFQVGRLPISGHGVPARAMEVTTMEELSGQMHATNMELLSSLRADAHSSSLMEACAEDAILGRMSHPRPLQIEDLECKHMSPRFGVVQGGICCIDMIHGSNHDCVYLFHRCKGRWHHQGQAGR